MLMLYRIYAVGNGSKSFVVVQEWQPHSDNISARDSKYKVYSLHMKFSFKILFKCALFRRCFKCVMSHYLTEPVLRDLVPFELQIGHHIPRVGAFLMSHFEYEIRS